jgi:hypothetical protein
MMGVMMGVMMCNIQKYSMNQKSENPKEDDLFAFTIDLSGETLYVLAGLI